MRWFENARLEWIKETIEIFGYINREHIEKKFGISQAQAAHDLGAAKKRWPKLLAYNTSSKRYEARLS